jgi:hypothetical protein
MTTMHELWSIAVKKVAKDQTFSNHYRRYYVIKLLSECCSIALLLDEYQFA